MTMTIDRPTIVDDPERDRLAHYPRDAAAPFPKPSLCGVTLTRNVGMEVPVCAECKAIRRG